MRNRLVIAVWGAGFAGDFHVKGWQNVRLRGYDVEVVAIVNRTKSRAEKLMQKYGIEHHFDDLTQMLDSSLASQVDAVDICLPTFLHAEYCKKGLEAGKHVLCEKPMALTYAECQDVLTVAEGAPGKFMIAHCVRFFPAYEYLNETVESGRFGRLLELSMWRGGPPPGWSWQNWLLDHKRSGGGVLDLHVHDADFVHYLLGEPRAVCSTAAVGVSGGYDAVESQYIYDDKMAVRAGANLSLPTGFSFEAHFMAAFEKGCLRFSSAERRGLLEITGKGSTHPHLPEKNGYQEEIAYFVSCIQNDEMPAVVTPESSAFSVRLIEAERESVETGRSVEL